MYDMDPTPSYIHLEKDIWMLKIQFQELNKEQL